MRDQDTLVFDLQDLFKEKIDSVYVLCDITPAWWISEIIGIEYDKSILSDDEQRIILVSGKGILYSESLTWSGWSRVLWNGPTNHSKKKKQVIVRKVNKDAILPYYLIDMSDDGQSHLKLSFFWGGD